jgi:hypothetical protein
VYIKNIHKEKYPFCTRDMVSVNIHDIWHIFVRLYKLCLLKGLQWKVHGDWKIFRVWENKNLTILRNMLL